MEAPPVREALRIEIRTDSKTRSLIMSWSSGGQEIRRIPTALREEQLPELRAQLGRMLQEAKNLLGTVACPSWPSVAESLKKVSDAGNMLMFNLFPRNGLQMRQLWQDCFSQQLVDPTQPSLIILVSARTSKGVGQMVNLLLPWEFLPLFRPMELPPTWFPEVRSRETMEEVLNWFVGYRSIVSRVLATTGEQRVCDNDNESATHLNGSPRLHAKLFVCRALDGVREEERRLQTDHGSWLAMDVWPRHGEAGNTAELAEFLWKTTYCTRRQMRTSPDQVHHFATHFDTTSNHPDQHFFTLACCPACKFEVRLGDLQAKLGAWSSSGQLPESQSRPLIFVNACGTSHVDPQGITSLPELFLGALGSRGFIGTETTISDSFAPEFAAEFYAQLRRGAPVGRALHDARRALVAKLNNPLGLFYTSYADPALRVHPTPN